MNLFKNKNTKLTLLLAFVVLITAVGFSAAYFNSTTAIANKLQTPLPEVQLIEKFNQNEQFLPGETVEKKVKFLNSGQIDALIRVKYQEYWLNQDESISDGDVDVVTKTWTDAWNSQWLDGEDGYFYYKKVLKVNATTENIIENLTLMAVSNDTHALDYSNKIYQLSFNLDACCVSNEAAQKNFGKKATIIGENVTWSDYTFDQDQSDGE